MSRAAAGTECDVHLGGLVGYSGSTNARISTGIVNRMECATPLTIWEKHIQLEHTSLPQSALLAWNSALPALQVKGTLLGSLRLCDEAERVVTTPLLPEMRDLRSAHLRGEA